MYYHLIIEFKKGEFTQNVCLTNIENINILEEYVKKYINKQF